MLGPPSIKSEDGGGDPDPSQEWCSLWEGDGSSPPTSEGWWVRTWGSVSISSGVSGGETVAINDDPSNANGGWMQRWMDFEPPFELAVRGRYDPGTLRTGFVYMAYFFTGSHALLVGFYPTYLRIGGPNAFDIPAIQGTWYNITFDVKAPLDVDIYRDGLLEGNVEMEPVDSIIWDQPLNKPVIAAIVTGTSPPSLGMVDYIRTTMCPPTEVGPKTPDRDAPLVLNVTLDDGVRTPSNDLLVSEATSTVWLNATVDDTTTGNSPIWSSNYTVGASNFPGTPMTPADGGFDSPVEDVTTVIDVSGLAEGNYTYCVHGRDYYGNWDSAGSCAVMRIGKQEPPRIYNLTLDDGVRPPSSFLEVPLLPGTNVWLNATIDDGFTGNSTISSANYTVAPQAWPGVSMSPADGNFDSPVENVSASLDVYSLGEGNHTLCVYAIDAAGNANLTGSCVSLNVTHVRGQSQVDPLIPYWWRGQAVVTASTIDGSFPVDSVDLYYNYSSDNVSWSGWTYWETALSSPWTWTFPFPDGDGFYGFYSVARDTSGIEEPPPIAPDAIVGYDTTPPTSSVQPLAPYWRNADSVDLTADAGDSLSGVSNVTFLYRFSGDNASWSTWVQVSVETSPPYGTTFIAPDGDGYYEFRSDACDVAGNAETDAAPEARIALDREGPLTSVLQPSPYWTNATTVGIEAVGADALSGIAQVDLYYRFSSDNASWTSWTLWDSDSAAPWTFTFEGNEGDGYYEFYSIAADLLGNSESSPAAADAVIALDSSPPAGSVIINGGDAWTNSTSVTLTLAYSDILSGVSDVRYSNDGTFDTEAWESPSSTKQWTLAGVDGSKTVWFEMRDKAYNTQTVSDDIGLDTSPPTSSLNPLSNYWFVDVSVPLTAQASDDLSGVETVELFYRWSSDNITFTSWTSVGLSSAPPWSFSFDAPDGDGFYEMMTRAVDAVGNIEPGGFAEIPLAIDTTPPTTEALPVTPYDQDAVPIAIGAQGSDALSGLVTMQLMYRFSEDNLSWTPWQSLGQVSELPYEWNFSAPEGEGYYEFFTQGRDVLGNAEPAPGAADSRMAYFRGGVPPGGGPGDRIQENWKPFMALVFTIVLLVVASVLISRRTMAGVSAARTKGLLVVAVLFSVLELVTGAASMVTPALAIPPGLGMGTLIDVAVLAVGLAILLVMGFKKSFEEADLPPPPEG